MTDATNTKDGAGGGEDGGGVKMWKRDHLVTIQNEVQAKWEAAKVFEQDAPITGDAADFEKQHDEKFMATFPYPYMNGKLHLGHTFTISKADFAVGYQKLLGKKCLFPFGFHCTGMPIRACADRLSREMAEFGTPPVFPTVTATEESAPAPDLKAKSDDPLKYTANKTKLAQKQGVAKYQWQIMQSLGLEDAEIAKFGSAEQWLQYFPPYAVEDLKAMGAKVDWRRSFITTDINPYYDSFVRWQFNTLKALGNKVLYGNRFTMWSPLDNQPCADHDRSSGEGIVPQEYTLIKMKVVEPYPESLKAIAESGRNVYLVPATLRPETMYGQTNCFVLPTGEYGAFEVDDKADGDVFVCSARAARNLAFQGHSPKYGETSQIATITGQDLMGTALKAPLGHYETVHVLPLLSISMTKGTGVVTSVPSDSPDDFAALRDLKNKAPLREKFGIKDEWVLPFDVVPIINIPGELGNLSAEKACDMFKVGSQNDRERLDKAKDMCYKLGFHSGVMTVGAYAGKAVSDAKPLVRDDLIKSNDAIAYAEPSGRVVSRSGDECVVCLTNQWYMNYGEEGWRAQMKDCLDKLNLYSKETRTRFEASLDWLKEWACSRTYGLGTKLPWDEQFLIESLSDSTIYMSYYTIAHILQGGVMDGSKTGPGNIKPEQMTHAIWDHILLAKPLPETEKTEISSDTLALMKREFEFWYPVNLRVSGKDLIQNHLTMFLYNHVAVFPEKHWPTSVRTNGFLQLNNEKMSKSTGNFLTLKEALIKYSADGMRLTMASAGDLLDDANFSEGQAMVSINHLYTFLEFINEMVTGKFKVATKPLREDGDLNFWDQVFDSRINAAIGVTKKHFDGGNYKEAMITGFYELTAAKDQYRSFAGDEGMLKSLIMRYIEVQTLLLAPICPHTCEAAWEKIGKDGFAVNGTFPVVSSNASVLDQYDYMVSAVSLFRAKIEYAKKKAPPTKGDVFVGASFPEWQAEVMTLLAERFDETTKTLPGMKVLNKDIMKIPAVQKLPKKQKAKQVMALVNRIRSEVEGENGLGRAALALVSPFDELELLKSNAGLVQRQLGENAIPLTFHLSTDADAPDDARKAMAVPGKPTIAVV
eukprot:TRINITY_DN17121_c0_g1_i1.p1 TRINITY_DN17121_c0_g1~~TRINITY_DN17121_c0_g1_i1.p1  ORF type:complete len:1099 (+),score=351.70 TRINITY_DN17121_c0_g1_i1:38-3334(+)